MQAALHHAVCSLLFLGALTAPVTATPFAGVQNAFWSAQFAYYNEIGSPPTSILPDGIVIGCLGGGAVNLGCSSSAGLIVHNGSASLSQTGSFSVTNNGETDLPGGLIFNIHFSAFNSGGPPIGAFVDDPSYQFAFFSSSVSGPLVADAHGCDTRVNPNMGPNACGVFSPDFSTVQLGVGPLSAGQTSSISYQIKIAATVFVPEPLTVSLFGAGLAGALALRRRRIAK